MDNYNLVRTLVEVGTKLTKKGKEPLADPTYFKQIVGSLRYLVPYLTFPMKLVLLVDT